MQTSMTYGTNVIETLFYLLRKILNITKTFFFFFFFDVSDFSFFDIFYKVMEFIGTFSFDNLFEFLDFFVTLLFEVLFFFSGFS